MVKVKSPPSIHGALQNAVVATINDPRYSFSLPKLADWDSVVASSPEEKQRLEFVGDAVMHLSVALCLYRLFPDAAPGLYTNIRSAVNANATFTHLMVKAGAYQLPSLSHSTKAAADSFEVIVAAFYLERGFAEVCAWVQDQYTPLIAAARDTYDKRHRNIPFLSTKRLGGPLDPASTPLLKKIRLSNARSSPRSTLMAQRVIHQMKSRGKVKLCLPTKKSKLPLEMRLHSCELRTPEPQRPSPGVIDLTMDSESDDDHEAPSNATQASQPNFKPPSGMDSLCNWLPPLHSDTTHRAHQGSYKSSVFHWPPMRGSCTASLVPSYPPPPRASSPIATLHGCATSVVPKSTFEFCRRSGISLPSQSDNMHIPSGTHGNPIVIEDSETEDLSSRELFLSSSSF